ncbi:hypothetical protein [Shewanella sp. UCD-KL12]|uniref:hypothetical protein n=1 Tax=Shewanella sp. UCD-KL12 TaxID=1917163 RepID=UPI0015C3D754|nr:hypothetical protein [Shewanella sp. UCD-KL12]
MKKSTVLMAGACLIGQPIMWGILSYENNPTLFGLCFIVAMIIFLTGCFYMLTGDKDEI